MVAISAAFEGETGDLLIVSNFTKMIILGPIEQEESTMDAAFTSGLFSVAGKTCSSPAAAGAGRMLTKSFLAAGARVYITVAADGLEAAKKELGHPAELKSLLADLSSRRHAGPRRCFANRSRG